MAEQEVGQEKAIDRWEGAQGLAEDVRYYGKWMRDEAEKRIGHLYPKVKITAEMAKDRPDLKEYVGEELTVIAWLWAGTVAARIQLAGRISTAGPLYCSERKRGRKLTCQAGHRSESNNTYRFEV